MAKLKIYTFPDLVLAQKAKPVDRVEKSIHRKLADDMLETMYHAPGIGLAANQVGRLERFLVVDTEYDLRELVPGEQAPELMEGEEIAGEHILSRRKPIVLINPEIIHKEGSIQMSEGCLSVPEYNAEVKRAEKIKVRYQDIDGLERTLAAEGLMAVCIQHEMDHLEGRLFIDRLSPLKKEMAKKKLRADRRLREAEEEMKLGGALFGGRDPKGKK